MATTKIAKKLPKRVNNEALKARRKRSWQQGQDRKAARRAAQRTRSEGTLSPYQQRKREAAAQHAANTKPKEDNQPLTATPRTSYPDIRANLDRFLRNPGITPSYLDDIHRRWRIIGKLAKAGRL